ncbi:uncharacterized protein LOC129963173 isoform X2 [Argiope bruennichi]|uniref:uncharacterized protein LOC129963173 isoform X2 n=1 Tax=Argiope bruennichi TaxID=94029 RepID=UPI00249585BA|nr:uncharacterized protein LOC129963173 isoform X2 [Argiope bruennichi]
MALGNTGIPKESSMGRCVRRSSSMMSPPLSIQLLKSLFLPLVACLYTFMGCVSCGSVAVMGSGSHGRSGEATENWGVLSQGTQIFLIILGIFMGIFLLYGVYRLYFWCQKDPRRT